MLERWLNELPDEQQNDPEVWKKIFTYVVGYGGHGYALLKGACIRPTSTKACSSQLLLEEINQLKKEAEDRETRHLQELEELKIRNQQALLQMKNDMRSEMRSEMQSLFQIFTLQQASTTSTIQSN